MCAQFFMFVFCSFCEILCANDLKQEQNQPQHFEGFACQFILDGKNNKYIERRTHLNSLVILNVL
jgi:hypothetical protein